MRMLGGTHLRVGHGWTLEQYREAFHLPAHTPTCSHELSDGYRKHAVERLVVVDDFGRPPQPRPVPRIVRSPRWRSLADLHPELVAELSPRNEDFDPTRVAAGSRQRPWWRCGKCGHEWQATVANRTVRGSGCPKCGVRSRAELRSRVEPERSLLVTRPDLAAELDPDRNGGVDLLTLATASSRRMWWRCGECGHSWEATVASRTAGGTGCPACWDRRRGAAFSIVPEERSLARRAPEVASELHPTRNPPDLNPLTLGAQSSLRVWWLCGTCGHEWQARVADRASATGCPVCARRPRS